MVPGELVADEGKPVGVGFTRSGRVPVHVDDRLKDRWSALRQGDTRSQQGRQRNPGYDQPPQTWHSASSAGHWPKSSGGVG
jgi:hypothetical protein